MRIYSNFSEQEINLITQAAKKEGLSLSAFVKSVVLEKVKGENTTAPLKSLQEKLAEKKIGDVFIVADLYDGNTWRSLSRAEKLTISKQLAKYARENPDKLVVDTILLPGKVTQYKKIGQ